MDTSSRVRIGPWGRNGLRRYTAPERLRARIRGDLARSRERISLRERVRALLARVPAPWLGTGFGFAAGALAGAVALTLQLEIFAADPVAREVVSNHVRSLMADHLRDVSSSDEDTVKSWFRGRLDYAPRVADMSAIGYSLLGGRLDYVGDRPVAAVVYSRARHLVNVFACPLKARPADARAISRRGFNAISWSYSAMQYWVVADLDQEELARFAGRLRASTTSPE